MLQSRSCSSILNTFYFIFFTNRHEQFAKLTARSLVLVAPRR